jgi:hypothetical protein
MTVRHATTLGAVIVLLFLLTPSAASAQTSGWEVDIAPMYFWAASTSGNIAINGTKNIPLYLSFSDVSKNLAGAFAFRGEVKKGRWGVLGDVFFIRLSSDVSYTTPILSQPIAGTLKLDEILLDGKVTFEVKSGSRFYLVGGVRTVTMSPTIHFTGPTGGQLLDIDVSNTVPAAVGGFIYRPKLGDRVVLLVQADAGGGAVFTASATGGIEFLIKPWIGLAAGYNALRVDTGAVPSSGLAAVETVEAALNQYGPVFTLTFHWR